MNWEKVHIFISSTFNDMHAERDYLVKRVFPELSDWCEQRKLSMVDVDLRWGVTEEDATANANVVQTCLKRIDDCRPFFLCFLGQRYGWIPKKEDISTNTFNQFPGLDSKIESGTSVTELEILHAIVEPFQKDNDSFEDFGHVKHTYFYLRDEDYIDNLPKEPVQLRRIYTDKEEKDLIFQKQLQKKLKKLKDEIIPKTGRPIRHYQAVWDDDSFTPEIALPLLCPALLDENISRWQADWQKALNLDVPISGREVPNELLSAGENYNKLLTSGRLADFCVNEKTLHEVVLADLKEAIFQRFPDHMVIGEKTDLQQEMDQHEVFLFANSEGFIERGNDFDILDDYVQGNSNSLLALTAEGGTGKSMLLAKWIDRCRKFPKKYPETTFHVKFIGKSDRSNTVYELLYYLLREFQEIHGKIPLIEIPKEPQELRSFWREQLIQIGKLGKTVIVIDALNQLESGLNDLFWLPMSGLPSNIKIVVSFRTGDRKANELYETLRHNEHVLLSVVESFNNPEHRRQLVNTYLSQFLKELDRDQVEQLISIKGASNPLFLKVVLSELRVFGAFQQLKDRIESDFGDNPVSAFSAVLRRLEKDPCYSIIAPGDGVPLLFGLLLHARHGLSPNELSELFLKNLAVTGSQYEQVKEAVHLFLRQVKPYLGRREGRYNIFYESLEVAVRERYTSNAPNIILPIRPSTKWHGLLADYFVDQSLYLGEGQSKSANLRKLTELPYQQAHAKTWDRLEHTLIDYDFLEAKIWALGPHLLIDDYEEGIQSGYVGEILPVIKNTLHLSAPILVEDPLMLPAQLLGRLHDDDNSEVHGLLEKARRWQISPWLRPISVSLTQPGGGLKRTLIGHTKAVRSMVITEDSRFVISGSDDQTIIVWDLVKGLKLDTLIGHTGSVQSLAVTPNGRFLISGSSNGGIRVWNLQQGSEIQSFDPQGKNTFDKNIFALAVSTNGKKAFSGGTLNDILIWDLEKLKRFSTLSRPVLGRKGTPNRSGHDDWVRALAITANGRNLISGSDDKTLGVWDLNNGKAIFLKGHKDFILAIAVTPDGLRAISSDNKGEIRVWDLIKGKVIHKLNGHNGMVSALAVSIDGRLAFSGSIDRTIKVWDIEKGIEIQTVSGLSGSIYRLAVSPDGKSLISASSNGPLQEWDLNKILGKQHSMAHTLTVWGVDISSDSKFAISASADKTLKVWDLQYGSLQFTIQTDHEGSIASVVITQDGRYAVSGAGDALLMIWDLARKKKVGTLKGHQGIIWDLDLISNRNQIISASHDKTLKVWDLKRKKCIQTLSGHEGPVESVAVTPNGQLAISGSADGVIKVWDMKRGLCIDTPFRGLGAVLTLAVTPDGKRFVSGHEGGNIKVWNLENLKEILNLSGHTKPVESVMVTSDGQRVISSSSDRTIKLWDLESGKIEMSFIGDSEQFSSKCTQDGSTIVAGENLGLVHFLRLENLHLDKEPYSLISKHQIKKRSLPGLEKFTRIELETLEDLLIDVFMFLSESNSNILRIELANFNIHWAKNQTIKDSIFTEILPQLVNTRSTELISENKASHGNMRMPISSPVGSNKLIYGAIKFRALLRAKLTDDEYRKFFTSFLSWSLAVARAIAGRYRGIGEVSKQENSVRALNAAFPVDSDLKISAEELEKLATMFKN